MSPRSKSSNPAIALVTGAARRIGACIAETLHGRGCTVFLHYHGSESDAQALAERLNQRRPGSARILQADLLDPDAPQKLASAVAQQTERLDLLVNNASMFYPTTVGETTGEDWKKLMGSNLKGPFFLTQALLPQLRAAAGSVVNILDVYADRPMAGHAVYSTAKAGQAMMTRALAKELGPDVRVNGVSPGAILWPQNEPDEETRQRIISRIVMRRPGTPADIAGAVAFLGLDAPYVTGQVLAVDGGRSLNI